GVEFVKSTPAAEPASPPKPIVTPWQYGWGEYDSSSQRVKDFHALPHFSGEAWQGGANWPDAKLGWVQLTAEGGHAGNDLQHAAVRRWIAPRDSVVQIRGRLAHEETAGDGIRAFVVSSRAGLLQEWTLHNTDFRTTLSAVIVQAGDSIDFIVNRRDNLNSDMFKWRPVISSPDPGVMA